MPGQKCCVVADKTVGFHRFPARDPMRRSSWLNAFEMNEDDIIPSSRVCSRHFPGGDSTKTPSLDESNTLWMNQTQLHLVKPLKWIKRVNNKPRLGY